MSSTTRDRGSTRSASARRQIVDNLKNFYFNIHGKMRSIAVLIFKIFFISEVIKQHAAKKGPSQEESTLLFISLQRVIQKKLKVYQSTLFGKK